MKTYHGIAASGGIAIGPAFLYHPRPMVIGRTAIGADEANAEVARWDAARHQALNQLARLQSSADQTVGTANAAIFEAHALMLEDPALLEMVETKIRQESLSAPAAVEAAAAFYADAIAALRDPCQRDRAVDVRDVAQRVIRLLLGVDETPWKELNRPAVLVAHDLTPSDTISMDPSLILGLCTAAGGITSHSAILARAAGMPAVLGLGDAWAEVVDGETIIVDGTRGLLICSPDQETLADYGARQAHFGQAGHAARVAAAEPAITRDGRRFEVVANLGDVCSAHASLEYGAEGVGLLRTEFLFMDRGAPPDEEEQTRNYRAIASIMGQRPLVIRTLDVGGDKPLPYLEQTGEANPFLGCRGIRFLLANPHLLRSQLRAILRAGVGHNVKILLPMVAALDEVRSAKDMVAQTQAELRAEGVETSQRPEIGIMVEVPAAAILADLWAPEVDFLSVGTNDLTQYTLAVDRGDEQTSSLYDPLNPAVLRLIEHVVEAGRRHGKWVGVCGEMAGDLEAIPLLVGLGLDEFSMNAAAIPAAKQLIRRLDAAAMRQLAARALASATAAEVHALVSEIV